MITVFLLLIWRVPETTSFRAQHPTLIWASIPTLGPPNKTPVWIKRVQNTGRTKRIGPQHITTASHCLFIFTLLSLCIHRVWCVSHTSLRHIFGCVCIIQCIYILVLLLYVEDQHPNCCCHWEACILAFTGIVLIAYYVLDGFFLGQWKNTLKKQTSYFLQIQNTLE